MLTVVFVLCLVGVCIAETNASYDLKCSEHENASATMDPSDDGIAGRYTTQVCVEMMPNVTKWELNLLYKEGARYCYKSKYGHPRNSHSTFVANPIDDQLNKLNCTHVCLTTLLDYIYKSCYVLKSVLYTNTSEFPPYDSYIDIANQYSSENFDKDPAVIIMNHEKDSTINFFVPVRPNEYSVELSYLNKTLPHVVDMNSNCTITDSISLECTAWVGPGCYKIWLKNWAPWVGKFTRQALVNSVFCRTEKTGVDVTEWAGWSAVWASVAAALLLGLAALLWRHRDHRHLHKRVLRYWTRHSSRPAPAACGVSVADGAGDAGAGEGEGVVRVLLLYARECERGQRLVAALRDLLQQHAHVQVQELFSAECVRAAGAAPHAWVQRALHTQRVLVLQTPALAALYTPRHTQHNLSAPLLGAGAMYRTPHYGDTLLQYALRLLADDACHPLAYRKYYLATLSALPTELFPGVVPFTRYELPAASALLVRDVTTPTTTTDITTLPAATPDTPALLHLQQAAEEFASYVQLNPDYLMDELLIT